MEQAADEIKQEEAAEEIKQEPVEGDDGSAPNASTSENEVTSSNAHNILTDELDIKVEYDSDISISSDAAAETDDVATKPEDDDVSTSCKRRRGPDGAAGARKRHRRDVAEIEADYEVHKQLFNLEIELLKALIEKERVEIEYNRSIFELKMQQLDLKTWLHQT